MKTLSSFLGKLASEHMNLINCARSWRYQFDVRLDVITDCIFWHFLFGNYYLEYWAYWSMKHSHRNWTNTNVQDFSSQRRTEATEIVVSYCSPPSVDETTDSNSRKKSVKIWICIDLRHLSRTLMFERYQLPTTENVRLKLRNARYFTDIDVAFTYWGIVLDEESSHLITFQDRIRSV